MNHSDTSAKSPLLEMHAMSVFWYAVGVWQAFGRLTPTEQKAAAEAAGDALACDAALVAADGAVDIPHFGKCSGHRATAIMSCFIVSRSLSEHIDSPFLAAARNARRFTNPPVPVL